MADGLSTALGILLPLIAKFNPRWGSAMSDLIWQIPLTAMSTFFVVRLVLSPYWLYEQREQAALGIEDSLRKQIATQGLQLDTRNEQLRERMRRRAICENLAALLESGDRILKLHIELRLAQPELVAAWESEVRDYIESSLNQIYAARFSSESGMMVHPGTATNSTRPILNTLHTRLERLKHFIEELCSEIDN